MGAIGRVCLPIDQTGQSLLLLPLSLCVSGKQELGRSQEVESLLSALSPLKYTQLSKVTGATSLVQNLPHVWSSSL